MPMTFNVKDIGAGLICVRGLLVMVGAGGAASAAGGSTPATGGPGITANMPIAGSHSGP